MVNMNIQSKYVGQWFLYREVEDNLGKYLEELTWFIKENNPKVKFVLVQDITRILGNEYLITITLYHDYDNKQEIVLK
jgi:hypothetical protein